MVRSLLPWFTHPFRSAEAGRSVGPDGRRGGDPPHTPPSGSGVPWDEWGVSALTHTLSTRGDATPGSHGVGGTEDGDTDVSAESRPTETGPDVAIHPTTGPGDPLWTDQGTGDT